MGPCHFEKNGGKWALIILKTTFEKPKEALVNRNVLLRLPKGLEGSQGPSTF